MICAQLCSQAQYKLGSASGKVVHPLLAPILLFKVAATIKNSRDCEVHFVICFLWVKNCTAVEIHHKLCVEGHYD